MDRLYYTLMIKLETSNPKKGQRLSNRSVCASFGEKWGDGTEKKACIIDQLCDTEFEDSFNCSYNRGKRSCDTKTYKCMNATNIIASIFVPLLTVFLMY